MTDTFQRWQAIPALHLEGKEGESINLEFVGVEIQDSVPVVKFVEAEKGEELYIKVSQFTSFCQGGLVAFPPQTQESEDTSKDVRTTSTLLNQKIAELPELDGRPLHTPSQEPAPNIELKFLGVQRCSEEDKIYATLFKAGSGSGDIKIDLNDLLRFCRGIINIFGEPNE